MASISESISITPTSLSARIIEDKDLVVLADWWSYSHSDNLPVNILSDIGIMITSDEKPVAAGFLYETNSKLCFSDFCIVNPILEKKCRDLAIKNLMHGIVRLAEKRGFSVMFVHARIPKLKSRLAELNFMPLADVTYFGRALNV